MTTQDHGLACPTDLSGDCSAAIKGAIAAAAAVSSGRKSVVLPAGRMSSQPVHVAQQRGPAVGVEDRPLVVAVPSGRRGQVWPNPEIAQTMSAG